jgi:zinc protease
MKKKHALSGPLLLAAYFILLTACNNSSTVEKLKIPYEKYTMQNGLQVVLHTDHSDPVIAYAIMYHVGSGREKPGKTGFAHLFEHLLFGGSENVPAGKFDQVIEEMGGSNNGFTTRDVTTYFEIFPENALERILWLESDRMGYFINSVTPHLLALQQNVVQNEKRQREDNTPYGFTDYVIDKYLYPSDHPYHWEVIGEMQDLKNATIDDVRNYYSKFYGPGNATLVLSGDFDPDSVKILLNKYFSEIKPHGEVEKRGPMTVTLDRTKRLYHEDEFANAPELTMVWPVPQQYARDSYALDFLASILADGKKAPFYKVLVKEKQLTSETNAYDNKSELAGEFTISIRANEGKSLKDIEKAVSEAFDRFEKDGITENDVERIKATSEKSFYSGLSSVMNKSFRLAFYNTFLDNPGYIEKDLENIKAVTTADIMSVYQKYIKGKPHIVTSFVPKGRLDLAADSSVEAEVKTENIKEATQVPITEEGNEQVVKTPSGIDRAVEPPAGKEPMVRAPRVWRAQLSNGIRVYGIENKELPLVSLTFAFDGGVWQDSIKLPGVASMVASVLPQGTKNRTPEDLEEQTELLGSAIEMYPGREELYLSSDMLSRNFDKTVSLIREIILEPRWDSTEFSLARTRTLNSIIQGQAQPGRVASLTFYRMIYGTGNIFGYNSLGSVESMKSIKLENLKSYFDKCFSPTVTRIMVAGNISEEQVLAALKPLETDWKSRDVVFNTYESPVKPGKSAIYFVDMPGSKQSVIYAGYPALSRENPDWVKADFINYRLGGAFTSILNQILREQKGYTYGASSQFSEMKTVAPFIVATSVRSDATFESLGIIRDQLEKYRNGISDSDVSFIRNCIIRANALRFETNDALADMLATMSKYNFPDDYIIRDEGVVRNMTAAESKSIIDRYIVPDNMYYIVVGDKATQMAPLEKIGFGKPVLAKP